MPIFTNSKQKKDRTLEEFYIDLKNSSDKVTSEIGSNMLQFIEMINSIFKQTEIWGLTSHYHLVLQAEDKWDSEWYIKVGSLGNEYYFEYLLPDDKKPWDYAAVKGVAQSLEEAKKYLLISMKNCSGWLNNNEINDLLSMHGPTGI